MKGIYSLALVCLLPLLSLSQEKPESAVVYFEYQTEALTSDLAIEGFYVREGLSEPDNQLHARYQLYQNKEKMSVAIELRLKGDQLEIQCNDVSAALVVMNIPLSEFVTIPNSFGYPGIKLYCKSEMGVKVVYNLSNGNYYLLNFKYSLPDEPGNVTNLKFELPQGKARRKK